jgi:hypothetical protein
MSASICNNPLAVPKIDLDECIGSSLIKINNNYKDLYQVNCDTNSELNLIKTDLQKLTSDFVNLSSLNFSGLYPKVWVNFDGSTTIPIICSVNTQISGLSTVIPAVSTISRLGPGHYGLYFTTSLLNSSYCLVGSAKLSSTPCFVQPTSGTAFHPLSANIRVMTVSGTYINSELVSVAIYNL